MPDNDSIQVAFSVDENYAQHLCVAIMSLLQNINPDVSVKITVIGDRLSPESVSRLKQIANGNKVSIVFPDVDFDLWDDWKVIYHYSRAMYGRLLIPEMIDGDKVLYLDCDILIKSDISDLWKLNISGHYAGAVVDPALSGIDEYFMPPGEHVMPSGEPYFNSGILLLNLKKCREDNLMQRVSSFISQNSARLHFPDQDALNVVMQGAWYPLHPRWNLQSVIFKMCYRDTQRRVLPEDFIEAVKNPAIVHYTDAVKPWHYECLWPYVEEYYNYLAKSPWYEFRRPHSPNWESFMRIHRRKFKRRLKSLLLGYRI